MARKDGQTVNQWVLWGVVAAVAVLVIAGGVVGGIFLWRRQVRRALMRLVGHREAIRAAYRGLESTFASLACEGGEELVAFATDPAHVRRAALAELQERMDVTVDDLREIALPKAAWHCADLLMGAAQRVRDEIGKITGAESADGVLQAVAEIDVEGMRSAMADAGMELDRLLADAGITDSAIYGGGLYI